MATWVHRFSVKGFGCFPLDMLRYDACYPEGSEDAGNIDRALDRDISGKDRKDTAINLVHVGSDRVWQPTKGRWSSFMWTVVEVKPPEKRGG